MHFLFLDLASLASVRKFARDFTALGLPLHVLVNNGEDGGGARDGANTGGSMGEATAVMWGI